MSQTSDSNFERERWIQTSWPIHDIRGSQNAYVACGKFIQSYDMNGEVLRTFEFERASKWVFQSFKNISDELIFRVSSICLNEDESLVAGCSTSLVVVFDTSSSIILQTIHVPCLSISLIGSYIITGDAEGTIGKWEVGQSGIVNLEFKFVGNLKIKMHRWMPRNGPFLVKVFYQHL